MRRMICDRGKVKGKGQEVTRREPIKDRARDGFSRGDVTSDGSLSEKGAVVTFENWRGITTTTLEARVGAIGTSAIERGGMMKRVICLRGPKILTVLNTKNIGCGYEAVKAWQRQMHPLIAKARKCWPVHWMAVIGRWLQNSLPRLGP